MKIYDLSREIMTTAPYGNDPAPVIQKIAGVESDGYNLSRISMSLHAATHVDAPLHFIREGDDISKMDPAIFVGPCIVLTVPSRRLDAMFFMNFKLPPRILLRGSGELTGSGIGYLFNSGVRLVGTDRNSIGFPSDEKTVHTALLGYGIAVLENLDLDSVPDGTYTLCAAPLKIAGAEGAPCRALLIDSGR